MPLQGIATMGWHVHLPMISDVTARADDCLGCCNCCRSGQQDHSLTTKSLQNGQNIHPWARGLVPRRGLRRVGAADQPPHQYQHQNLHHQHQHQLLNRYRGHTHACFCFRLRLPTAALRRLSRRGPSTCCLNKGSPAWCRNALAECFETIDGRQAQNSRCAKDVDPLGVACLLPGGEIKMEHGNKLGEINLAITTPVEVVVSITDESK